MKVKSGFRYLIFFDGLILAFDLDSNKMFLRNNRVVAFYRDDKKERLEIIKKEIKSVEKIRFTLKDLERISNDGNDTDGISYKINKKYSLEKSAFKWLQYTLGARHQDLLNKEVIKIGTTPIRYIRRRLP